MAIKRSVFYMILRFIFQIFKIKTDRKTDRWVETEALRLYGTTNNYGFNQNKDLVFNNLQKKCCSILQLQLERINLHLFF